MKTDMLSPTLKENIENLKKVFYGSDPRWYGENPACEIFWDAITEEMDQWSDEKIRAFEASLTEKESELLYSVFWELANTRVYLCPKYTGGWFPPGYEIEADSSSVLK